MVSQYPPHWKLGSLKVQVSLLVFLVAVKDLMIAYRRQSWTDSDRSSLPAVRTTTAARPANNSQHDIL